MAKQVTATDARGWFYRATESGTVSASNYQHDTVPGCSCWSDHRQEPGKPGWAAVLRAARAVQSRYQDADWDGALLWVYQCPSAPGCWHFSSMAYASSVPVFPWVDYEFHRALLSVTEEQDYATAYRVWEEHAPVVAAEGMHVRKSRPPHAYQPSALWR